MIKIFSNQTTVPKITVQSKFLKDKTTILTPDENGLVKEVKTDTLLFVKVHISGLISEESYGKIQLALFHEEISTSCRLRLISCPKTTLTDAYMKTFANSLTGKEVVEETQIIEASAQYGQNEKKELKVVTLDLTNIAKKSLGNNPIFMFVIQNDNTTAKLNIVDPQFVANQVECCTGTLTNFGGLNSMYQFDKHSVGGTGTGYVNLYTRKLIHVIDGLTSLSKKMPITYSTIYNYGKSNEKNFLDRNLTPSFQYRIFKSGDEYVIEDPTGIRNYYSSIDKESDKGKELISTYNIKHLSENNGKLYFCNIDNSYLFLDTTTSTTKESITLYDQQDNKTIFEVSLNESTIALGRFTKIMSRETKFGDKLTYQWSGTKLRTIKNTDGEQAYFTYDSSDRITEVRFSSLKQYIQYTYRLDEWRINIACYSIYGTPDTKLKEVQLNYTEIDRGSYRELLLSNVTDKITGHQINYSNAGTISSVSIANAQNQKVHQVSYSYNSYCTTATYYNGTKHYYYFDTYGRCKLEMDDKGRSITYNYDEFENGESKHLTSVSNVQTNSRNLLENHSFEDSDNLFKSDSLGWKKTGGTNSKVETKIGGVYGEKYLFIDKGDNETITISQDVISPNTTNFTLKGFIKHQAKHTNENIATGNIKVKVSGTYTRDESVIVTVDSTTTKTEIRPVSHYHNKEVTFSGNSDWKPFSLTSTLPSDAYNITMKVELIVSGIASEVGIDDLQLCTGKQKIRYNLIENGYMEFVENGLPKGWLFENREVEDELMEVSSIDEHASVLGNRVMRFKEGDVQNGTEGNSFKIKKMYKEIPCHGLSGEQLIFSVLGMASASSGNIFRSYMKIYHTNGQYRDYRFDFDKNFKNWQMLTRAVTAEYDFDKVEVGIEYCGGNVAYFDAFQLYKDSYGKYYNYDERGNITEVISDDGNSMRIDYDEENQVREVIATDGSSFKYDYDQDGRLEKVTDISGNIVKIEYDANNYVVKTIITTPEGETIVNSQERDQYGNITKATNEHGDITLTSFDYLERIAEIQHPNEFSEYYNYNDDLTLQYLKADIGGLSDITFTYDEAKQIKTVTTENETQYDLVHDDFGRLTKISVNGEVINQFAYDEITNGVNKGLISQKKYGENGDYFDFIYNEEDQIEEVKLNGIPIIEYDYNEEGQVSEVRDIKNNTSKYFTYDLKGKLIKVVDNQNRMISHTYDNLEHIQKTAYKMEEIEKSFDFEYDYEMNEYTKEGYFNRIEKAFGDEVVKGGMNGKGTYGATAKQLDVQEVFDENLKMKVYKFTNTNQHIQYAFNTLNKNRTGEYSNGLPFSLNNWRNRLYNNKTAYMWIKPSGEFAEETLFKFLKIHISTSVSDTTDYDEISELISTKNGTLGYRSISGNVIKKETTNTLKLNEWNLVGIKLFKKAGETYSRGIIFLNGESTTEFIIPENVNFVHHVGVAKQKVLQSSSVINPNSTPSTTLAMPFQVCMMSFGAYQYTSGDMNSIYKEGLKYLVSPTPIQKATGVSYYNAEVYKDFDVITLNGSLESTRGNKPVALMQTDSSFRAEKARIFKYDSSIQRHVYGAFDDISNFTRENNSLLAYNLDMKNKGVISFRFKIDEEQKTPRYILSSYQGELRKLDVLVTSMLSTQSSECLRFVVNGQVLTGYERITYHHWYNVVLFFKENEFCIYVDGKYLYSENCTLDLTDCTTYIGSLKDGSAQLNGYVEMLSYSNKEVAISNYGAKAKNICENGKTISIRNHLDSLGRVTQKVITTNKTEYKTTYVQDKLRISREVEPDTHNIKYEYDSMGNIIKKQYKIKDIDIDCTSYQYDKLSRLIKEVHPNGDIETFTYDDNGNILTHQIKNKEGNLTTNEKYNYSITIKDQLVSIQNVTTGSVIKEYKYEDSYKGNPTKVITDGVSQTLTWEGRKLKQIGDIHFTYNEDGIRIKKQGTNFIEDYILDGSNIIGLHRNSRDGSYDMYFNYDEQGEIVGLSCEGKEYFYIRDITGNITKIVDEDGLPVVSYTYDAWGNFKKTIHIDCRASHSNPFVYKGYFFDSETGWFYLKSRYYDPTIRRFINADDFNYLDDKSLNGLNLYSYCGNNPILSYDPEGTWSWKKFWCVVAVVAIAAVVVAATIATAGAVASAVPALATAATVVATKVVVAAAVTVVEVIVAACTESVVALDFSLSFGYFLNDKRGATILFDFKNERTELYTHKGGYLGNSKWFSFNYTASFVGNYNEEGGYKGPFIFVGATYNGYGIDYCRGPESEDAYGIGVTVGTGKGFGAYVGGDYYWYLGGFNW